VTEQPRVARALLLLDQKPLGLTALLDLRLALLRLQVELRLSGLRSSYQLALRVQLLVLQVPERWPVSRQRCSATIAVSFRR
jgi:hypothetical protein